jgi:MoxR-like ATPase
VSFIAESGERVAANVERVIVGKHREVRLALVALLTGGHLLIEDVPGTGKTVLAKALARSLGCSFRRIQFTPDLLPTDVTGLSIYNQKSQEFEFRHGPIMSQIVLADEINRATPKTQSALLESMEERQVTVDGVTYPMPHPFLVIATQNPIEQAGTYRLPEAQLDRFLMKLVAGYPDREAELAMLDLPGVADTQVPLDPDPPMLGPAEVRALRAATGAIRVAPALKSYIVDLIRATRDPLEYGLDLGPLIELGASPRATLALVRASQGHALISGRDYVTPFDVKAVAPDVLRHRLLVSYEADAEGLSPDAILRRVLDSIRVP